MATHFSRPLSFEFAACLIGELDYYLPKCCRKRFRKLYVDFGPRKCSARIKSDDGAAFFISYFTQPTMRELLEAIADAVVHGDVRWYADRWP